MCFSLWICEVGKGDWKEGENENIEMMLERTTEVGNSNWSWKFKLKFESDCCGWQILKYNSFVYW